jgi:hypothetical protein
VVYVQLVAEAEQRRQQPQAYRLAAVDEGLVFGGAEVHPAVAFSHQGHGLNQARIAGQGDGKGVGRVLKDGIDHLGRLLVVICADLVEVSSGEFFILHPNVVQVGGGQQAKDLGGGEALVGGHHASGEAIQQGDDPLAVGHGVIGVVAVQRARPDARRRFAHILQCPTPVGVEVVHQSAIHIFAPSSSRNPRFVPESVLSMP